MKNIKKPPYTPEQILQMNTTYHFQFRDDLINICWEKRIELIDKAINIAIQKEQSDTLYITSKSSLIQDIKLHVEEFGNLNTKEYTRWS